MINKQKIYTAIGVIISFIIAIGGWFLIKTLIDIKSETLLSATGTITVDPPSTMTSPAMDEVSNYLPILNGQEIVSILKNWEADGRERLHEPIDGQISMESAIEISRNTLLNLSSQGLIPVEFLGITSTTAYLGQKIRMEEDSIFLKPMYSYWTVYFYGEYMTATMIINAVTGQVWNCSVEFGYVEIDEPDNDVLSNVLTAFISGIVPDSEDDIIVGEATPGMKTISISFANKSAMASIIISGRPKADTFILNGINLYLETNGHTFLQTTIR
jgi:hypothetical protein